MQKNLIKEANLIEEGNHEDGASREITSSIVMQEIRKHKSNEPKKKGKGLVVLKIALPFSNDSHILYRFFEFTQNLKQSLLSFQIQYHILYA